MAADAGLVHSAANGYGENLFWSAGSGTGDDQAVAAVDSWYSEINNYDWATGTSTGGAIGHFTQVRTIKKLNFKSILQHSWRKIF